MLVDELVPLEEIVLAACTKIGELKVRPERKDWKKMQIFMERKKEGRKERKSIYLDIYIVCV